MLMPIGDFTMGIYINMATKITKKLFFALIALGGLIFVVISFLTYFYLKKGSFAFFLFGVIMFGCCSIVSILIVLDKIKVLPLSFKKQTKIGNLTFGIISTIIASAIVYYNMVEKKVLFENLNDLVGILFFGLGGLAILLKSIQQKKKKKDD